MPVSSIVQPFRFAPAGGGTLIFQDAFTEASDTELSAHTPTLGTSWTRQFSSGAAAVQMFVIGASDRVEHNPARGAEPTVDYVYVSDAPASANYRVKATLTVAPASDDAVWVVARSADQSNYYAAGGIQGNRRLILNLANTITVLGTDSGSLANGDILELICTDSEKTFKINGVQVFTSANNDLTGIGRPGIGAGNLDDDNFNTWDIGAPGSWAFDDYEVYQL